jgi:UDP-N-acetylmuramate--alanine ligase
MGPVDTVVYSSAIPADNVELVEARRRGLRIWHRSAALAALLLGAEAAGVAGSHGKTTTAAMCAVALMGAGFDPSYVVGAPLAAPAPEGAAASPAVAEQVGRRLAGWPAGQSARLGSGPFVIEADESDGSFRQYPLSVAVVTAVEADHLDNWGDAVRYRQGFAAFARAPGLGLVVCAADDPGAAALAQGLRSEGRPVLTYGEAASADLRLTDVALAGGRPRATAALPAGRRPGRTVELRLGVPGRHNLHNAAAALAVGWHWGADADQLTAALARFRGAERRFTVVGESRGVTVVDDYAHHPSEIRATLAAARSVAPAARLLACFQPHLFTRTRDFADAFGAALAEADWAVVTDVYPAREQPLPGVTGELVAAAVAAHGGRVDYVPDLADAPAALAALARPGDLVLTLGAGSVTTLGPAVLRRLEAAA